MASRLPVFSSPSARDCHVAQDALATLGIEHLARRIYTEISGGERQLAMIARALSTEPRLLVMDEPTASLDFGNQARMLSQIRRMTDRGISVILSTHDPTHAFLCADPVTALHGGRLAALGCPAETVTPQTLRLLYDVDVVVDSLQGGQTVCAPVLEWIEPDGRTFRRGAIGAAPPSFVPLPRTRVDRFGDRRGHRSTSLGLQPESDVNPPFAA